MENEMNFINDELSKNFGEELSNVLDLNKKEKIVKNEQTEYYNDINNEIDDDNDNKVDDTGFMKFENIILNKQLLEQSIMEYLYIVSIFDIIY